MVFFFFLKTALFSCIESLYTDTDIFRHIIHLNSVENVITSHVLDLLLISFKQDFEVD